MLAPATRSPKLPKGPREILFGCQFGSKKCAATDASIARFCAAVIEDEGRRRKVSGAAAFGNIFFQSKQIRGTSGCFPCIFTIQKNARMRQRIRHPPSSSPASTAFTADARLNRSRGSKKTSMNGVV